jgi:hypothetical protein
MTDRNPWLTPGNGVLGELLDPSDPWAQMVHEIWQRRLRETDASSDAASRNVSALPSLPPAASDVPWTSLPAPADVPAPSMRRRTASRLPFELESWHQPSRPSIGDAGLSRPASWQSPPLLDQGPVWGSLFPLGDESLPAAGPAPARDPSNAIPGPGGLWGIGLRLNTDGTKLYSDGRRILIANPTLDPQYVFHSSKWTGKGGPTPGVLEELRRLGLSWDSKIYPAAPGSIGRDAGIDRSIANNINGALAEEATAARLRAQGFTVLRPVPDDGGGRIPDMSYLMQNPDPRYRANPAYNVERRTEVKSGTTSLKPHIRQQMKRDAAARDRRETERAKGEVLQAEGRLVRNLGRAPGAVGLGLDGLELFSAYRADGNRIGENTERAATGIAGGAAGGWGGAAAGGAGGAAIARKWKAPRGRLGLLSALVGGMIGAIGGDHSSRAIYDHVRRRD